MLKIKIDLNQLRLFSLYRNIKHENRLWLNLL